MNRIVEAITGGFFMLAGILIFSRCVSFGNGTLEGVLGYLMQHNNVLSLIIATIGVLLLVAGLILEIKALWGNNE